MSGRIYSKLFCSYPISLPLQAPRALAVSSSMELGSHIVRASIDLSINQMGVWHLLIRVRESTAEKSIIIIAQVGLSCVILSPHSHHHVVSNYIDDRSSSCAELMFLYSLVFLSAAAAVGSEVAGGV